MENMRNNSRGVGPSRALFVKPLVSLCALVLILPVGCIFELGDRIYPEGYLVLSEVRRDLADVEVVLPAFQGTTVAAAPLPRISLEEGRAVVLAPANVEVEYIIGDYDGTSATLAFAVENRGSSKVEVLLSKTYVYNSEESDVYRPQLIAHDAFRDKNQSDEGISFRNQPGNLFYDASFAETNETHQNVYERATSDVDILSPGQRGKYLFIFTELLDREPEFKLQLSLRSETGVEAYVFMFEKWEHFRAREAGLDRKGKAHVLEIGVPK